MMTKEELNELNVELASGIVQDSKIQDLYNFLCDYEFSQNNVTDFHSVEFQESQEKFFNLLQLSLKAMALKKVSRLFDFWENKTILKKIAHFLTPLQRSTLYSAAGNLYSELFIHSICAHQDNHKNYRIQAQYFFKQALFLMQDEKTPSCVEIEKIWAHLHSIRIACATTSYATLLEQQQEKARQHYESLAFEQRSQSGQAQAFLLSQQHLNLHRLKQHLQISNNPSLVTIEQALEKLKTHLFYQDEKSDRRFGWFPLAINDSWNVSFRQPKEEVCNPVDQYVGKILQMVEKAVEEKLWLWVKEVTDFFCAWRDPIQKRNFSSALYDALRRLWKRADASLKAVDTVDEAYLPGLTPRMLSPLVDYGKLRTARQTLRRHLDENRDILSSQSAYNQAVLTYYQNTLAQIEHYLGPTPANFVILVKGSTAAGRIAPGSDIELLIVTEQLLDGYTHNMMHAIEKPPHEGKSRGFYLYHDDGDPQKIYALVIHNDKAREIVCLSELCGENRAILDELKWLSRERKDNEYLECGAFSEDLIRLITSNCEHTLLDEYQENYFKQLIELLIVHCETLGDESRLIDEEVFKQVIGSGEYILDREKFLGTLATESTNEANFSKYWSSVLYSSTVSDTVASLPFHVVLHQQAQQQLLEHSAAYRHYGVQWLKKHYQDNLQRKETERSVNDIVDIKADYLAPLIYCLQDITFIFNQKLLAEINQALEKAKEEAKEEAKESESEASQQNYQKMEGLFFPTHWQALLALFEKARLFKSEPGSQFIEKLERALKFLETLRLKQHLEHAHCQPENLAVDQYRSNHNLESKYETEEPLTLSGDEQAQLNNIQTDILWPMYLAMQWVIKNDNGAQIDAESFALQEALAQVEKPEYLKHHPSYYSQLIVVLTRLVAKQHLNPELTQQQLAQQHQDYYQKIPRQLKRAYVTALRPLSPNWADYLENVADPDGWRLSTVLNRERWYQSIRREVLWTEAELKEIEAKLQETDPHARVQRVEVDAGDLEHALAKLQQDSRLVSPIPPALVAEEGKDEKDFPEEKETDIRRYYLNPALISCILNEYDLLLMSSLPENGEAEPYKLYLNLSDDGSSIIYKTSVNGKTLENTILLQDLNELKEEKLFTLSKEELLRRFNTAKSSILEVTSKRGHTLLNENQQIKPKPKDQNGRHTVHNLLINGIPRYVVKVHPEQAGTEISVGYLIERICGVGLTPNYFMLKLHHKDEAGQSQTSALLLMDYIEGKDLQKLCEDAEAAQALNQIHTYSFLQHLIRVLLTNPEDDQNRDYFLHQNRLIRIDNERVWVDLKTNQQGQVMLRQRSTKESKSTLQVKSFLFCLEQMKKTYRFADLDIHSQQVITNFLQLDRYRTLSNWLKNDTAYLAQHFVSLFTEDEFKRHIRLTRPDPVTLRLSSAASLLVVYFKGPYLFKHLYNNWNRLSVLLKAERIPTGLGLNLLADIYPDIKKEYLSLFDQYFEPRFDRKFSKLKNNPLPLKRFRYLTDGIYDWQQKPKLGEQVGHSILLTQSSRPNIDAISASLGIHLVSASLNPDNSAEENALSVRQNSMNAYLQAHAYLDMIDRLHLDALESQTLQDLLHQHSSAVSNLKSLGRSSKRQQHVLEVIFRQLSDQESEEDFLQFIWDTLISAEVKFKDLEFLSLFKTVIDDSSLERFLKINPRETLDISEFTRLTDGVFRRIASVYQSANAPLRQLIARNCNFLNIRPFSTFGEIDYLNLEVLDLTGNPNLKILQIKAPALQELNLSNCQQLAADHILAFDKNSPELKQLTLSDNQYLQNLNGEWNTLQSLIVSGGVLQALQIQASQLKQLTLNNNQYLINLSGEWKSLQSLILSGGALQIIKIQAPQLKLLQAKACPALTIITTESRELCEVDCQDNPNLVLTSELAHVNATATLNRLQLCAFRNCSLSAYPFLVVSPLDKANQEKLVALLDNSIGREGWTTLSIEQKKQLSLRSALVQYDVEEPLTFILSELQSCDASLSSMNRSMAAYSALSPLMLHPMLSSIQIKQMIEILLKEAENKEEDWIRGVAAKSIGFFLAANLNLSGEQWDTLHKVLLTEAVNTSFENCSSCCHALEGIGVLAAKPNLSKEQFAVLFEALLWGTQYGYRDISCTAVKSMRILFGNSSLSSEQVDTFIKVLLTNVEAGWGSSIQRGAIESMGALSSANPNLSSEQLDTLYKALLMKVQDKEEDVMEMAIKSIGDLSANPYLSNEQIDFLFKVLLTEAQNKEEDVRSEAAWSMGHLLSANPNLSNKQLDVLYQALLTGARGEDWNVQQAVVRNMGALSANPHLSNEQVNFLFKVLLMEAQNKNKNVRKVVVKGMGSLSANTKLSNEQFDSLFKGVLTGMQNKDVRGTAIESMTTLSVNPKLSSKQLDALCKAMLTGALDEDGYVREAAVNGMGSLLANPKLSSKQLDALYQALLALLAREQYEKWSGVRQAAVKHMVALLVNPALSKEQINSFIEALLSSLDKDDPIEIQNNFLQLTQRCQLDQVAFCTMIIGRIRQDQRKYAQLIAVHMSLILLNRFPLISYLSTLKAELKQVKSPIHAVPDRSEASIDEQLEVKAQVLGSHPPKASQESVKIDEAFTQALAPSLDEHTAGMLALSLSLNLQAEQDQFLQQQETLFQGYTAAEQQRMREFQAHLTTNQEAMQTPEVLMAEQSRFCQQQTEAKEKFKAEVDNFYRHTSTELDSGEKSDISELLTERRKFLDLCLAQLDALAIRQQNALTQWGQVFMAEKAFSTPVFNSQPVSHQAANSAPEEIKSDVTPLPHALLETENSTTKEDSVGSISVSTVAQRSSPDTFYSNNATASLVQNEEQESMKSALELSELIQQKKSAEAVEERVYANSTTHTCSSPSLPNANNPTPPVPVPPSSHVLDEEQPNIVVNNLMRPQASDLQTLGLAEKKQVFAQDIADAYLKLCMKALRDGQIEPPHVAIYNRLRGLEKWATLPDAISMLEWAESLIMAENDASNEAKQVEERRLAQAGAAEFRLTLHNVPNKGNCLFDSVSDQLEQRYEARIDADHLRLIAVQQMCNNPDRYAAFLSAGRDFNLSHIDISMHIQDILDVVRIVIKEAAQEYMQRQGQGTPGFRHAKYVVDNVSVWSANDIAHYCTTHKNSITQKFLEDIILPKLTSAEKVKAHVNLMCTGMEVGDYRTWADDVDVMALSDALGISIISLQPSNAAAVNNIIHYYPQAYELPPLVAAFTGENHYQSLRNGDIRRLLQAAKRQQNQLTPFSASALTSSQLNRLGTTSLKTLRDAFTALKARRSSLSGDNRGAAVAASSTHHFSSSSSSSSDHDSSSSHSTKGNSLVDSKNANTFSSKPSRSPKFNYGAALSAPVTRQTSTQTPPTPSVQTGLQNMNNQPPTQQQSKQKSQSRRVREGIAHDRQFTEIASRLGFVIATAYSEGDCFYDSVAQGINLLVEAGVLRDVKPQDIASLRALCSDYVLEEMERGQRENWVKLWLGSNTYERYRAAVRRTQAELDSLSADGFRLGDGYAIWGTPEVDGRIMCEKLGIRLHVMKLNDQREIIHQLVDSQGINAVGENTIDYQDPRTVHLICHRDVHFVPFLLNMKDHRALFVPLSATTQPETVNSEAHLCSEITSRFLDGDQIPETRQEPTIASTRIEEARALPATLILAPRRRGSLTAPMAMFGSPPEPVLAASESNRMVDPTSDPSILDLPPGFDHEEDREAQTNNWRGLQNSDSDEEGNERGDDQTVQNSETPKLV